MTAKRHPTVPEAGRWQGALSEDRTQQLWSAVAHRLNAEEKSDHRTRSAIGLALAAGVALVLLFGTSARRLWEQLPSDLAAGSAQGATQGAVLRTEAAPMEMTLEEGSALAMSARSTIELSAVSRERVELRLRQGSITCDVSKDPGRAFAVLAGDVEVRVVGTKFSVHHATSENSEPVELSSVKVEVERGIVEIWRRGQGRRLGRLVAGQSWTSEERFLEPSAARPPLAEPVPAKDAPSAANSAAPGGPSGANAQDSTRQAHLGPPATDSAAKPGSVDAASKNAPRELDPARQQFQDAAAARRNGDAAGAATIYEQFLRQHPGDARAGLAAFELGRLQMDALGRPGPALASLRQALRLSPGASFREDVLARITRVYALTGQGPACIKAKSSYQREFPGGVHRGELDKLCP